MELKSRFATPPVDSVATVLKVLPHHRMIIDVDHLDATESSYRVGSVFYLELNSSTSTRTSSSPSSSTSSYSTEVVYLEVIIDTLLLALQ